MVFFPATALGAMVAAKASKVQAVMVVMINTHKVVAKPKAKEARVDRAVMDSNKAMDSSSHPEVTDKVVRQQNLLRNRLNVNKCLIHAVSGF